jgi:hypothetical protein
MYRRVSARRGGGQAGADVRRGLAAAGSRRRRRAPAARQARGGSVSAGTKRTFRDALAVAGIVAGLLCAAAGGSEANGGVDPRLRYQLLSIAVEASESCDWARRALDSSVSARRAQLGERMLERELTDAGDLAALRERARQVFKAEGCGSRAIADLVATVRQVEGEASPSRPR